MGWWQLKKGWGKLRALKKKATAYLQEGRKYTQIILGTLTLPSSRAISVQMSDISENMLYSLLPIAQRPELSVFKVVFSSKKLLMS